MESTTNHPDAVEFLIAQHNEIRDLFGEVSRTGGHDCADAFQCLVRLLAVHETAEEEYLHPEVRRYPGGDELVEARLGEETDAKAVLAELERLGVDHPAFSVKFQAFRTAVDAHAEREEHDEFPLLRTHTNEDQLRNMGQMIEVAESMAPTHPHPHGPSSGTGNLLVGPFAAMADRVRDAINDKRNS